MSAPLYFLQVAKLFKYDHSTGIVTRRVTTGSRSQAGAVVGSDDAYGYLTVRINGASYKLHRVVWLLATGVWPSGDIDHINGNRKDNRLSNLRDVSRRVNLQNMRVASSHNQSTRLLGVYPNKRGDRFQAKISMDNRAVYLGTFDSEEEAHGAYLQAKRDLHAGCVI